VELYKLAIEKASGMRLGVFLHLMVYVAVVACVCSAAPVSPMQQHYDAAYRFQSAGNLTQAAVEYKLFLADALHRLANGRANTGEYAQAIPLYDEALKLAPSDSTLQLDYAGAAFDAKDRLKTKALAQSVLDTNHGNAAAPQMAKAHLMLGRAQMEMAQYPEAITQFKAAVAINAEFENTYALGMAYLSLPDKASAAAVFAKIAAGLGDTADVHMEFGRAYGESGYPDEAIQEFKKAIAKNRKLPFAHYSLGAAYLNRSGDSAFPIAEVEFRKELAIRPDDALSYPQLGRIAMSRHDYQEAEQDLNHAAKLDPANPDNFLLLGRLYTDMKRPADAIVALRKAIAATTDPSRNRYSIQLVHYRLGRLLMQSGDAEGARSEMKISEALLLASKNHDESRMERKPAMEAPLRQTHVAAPVDMDAEKTFEYQVSPLMAGSYSNLGLIAAVGKEYAEAVGYFEHAAQWNPALAGLDTNWGKAAFVGRQYAQAVGPLSRGLRAHPEDVQVRSMLGVSQYMSHDYEKALQTFQPMETEAEKIPALAAVMHGARGEEYASSGNHQQAVEELRAALQLNPADTGAKHALALSLIALGQKAEADTLLAEVAAAEASAKKN
jgi:tetratricopeptide (TPR) repeat protein